MTIILLLLSPALFAIFWIIRLQICISQRRRLVDAYGISYKKLQKMSCKQVKSLKQNIQKAEDEGNTLDLENVIQQYRP